MRWAATGDQGKDETQREHLHQELAATDAQQERKRARPYPQREQVPPTATRHGVIRRT